MKKIGTFRLFIFLIIFQTSIVHAQNADWLWVTSSGSNGDDLVKSMATDFYGNIYATGSFSGSSIVFGQYTLVNHNPGFYDLFIVKYDSGGNVLWAKDFGGSESDYGSAVATGHMDRGDAVYLGGSFRSNSIFFDGDSLHNTAPPYSDMFLVKMDPDGNVQWVRSSSGSPSSDATYAICTDMLDHVFISGPFQSTSITFDTTIITNALAPGLDFYIVKYSSSGDVIWARGGGGSGEDAVKAMAADSMGNLYACGYFFSLLLTLGNFPMANHSVGFSDGFLAKYDPNGYVYWSYNTGGAESDYASWVASDPQGNAFVGGTFRSNNIEFSPYTLYNTGPPYSDMYLVKYSPMGTVLWARTSAFSPSSDGMYSLCSDKNGNAIVTGPYQGESIMFGNTVLHNPAYPQRDFYVTKWNGNGDVVWAKGVEGPLDDAANSICTDAGNNIVMGGYFTSSQLTVGDTAIYNVNPPIGDLFIARLLNADTVSVPPPPPPVIEVYRPLPDSNAIWREASVGYLTGFCGDYQDFLDGDTIINGLIYNKVHRFGVQYTVDACGFCTMNVLRILDDYMGAYRNDIPAKKVWYVPAGAQQETLLYDFNLVLNEPFPQTYLYDTAQVTGGHAYISAIDSILIGTAFHKMFHVSMQGAQDYAHLIEGIGSTFGLLAK